MTPRFRVLNAHSIKYPIPKAGDALATVTAAPGSLRPADHHEARTRVHTHL